jgi:hypothetical protein
MTTALAAVTEKNREYVLNTQQEFLRYTNSLHTLQSEFAQERAQSRQTIQALQSQVLAQGLAIQEVTRMVGVVMTRPANPPFRLLLWFQTLPDHPHDTMCQILMTHAGMKISEMGPPQEQPWFHVQEGGK